MEGNVEVIVLGITWHFHPKDFHMGKKNKKNPDQRTAAFVKRYPEQNREIRKSEHRNAP